MAIEAKCPHCAKSHRVHVGCAGQDIACDRCKANFTVPAASSAPSPPPPSAPANPSPPPSPSPPQPSPTPPPSDLVRKKELKKLIALAADGDDRAIRKLVGPFIAQQEKIVMTGVSAKFGIFPTYDFFFLTDRRIGDLEITPLTGGLNVEVAYLQKIDAFVLNQPAIPILLRLFIFGLYVFALMIGFSLAASMGGLGVLIGILIAGLGIAAVYYLISPQIRRAYLHFAKSGVWLKLNGAPVGVLIFADRNKFDLLTKLTRAMSDLKRQLDKAAS